MTPTELIVIYALPMARFLAFAAVLLVLYGTVWTLVRRRKTCGWKENLRAFWQHVFLIGVLAYYVEALFILPVDRTPDRWDVVLINLLYAGYLLFSALPRYDRRETDH